MKKKLIDILVASIVTLTIIGVAGGTTLASYMDYQKYYEENMPEFDPADNATLLSIDAVLKDGVHYYKNNKAKPVRNDFVVTATWQPKDQESGEGVFEQILDPVKRPYDVETDALFAINGGDITISFGGFTDVITVELEDVVLSALEVVQAPYVTKYQVGQVFDRTGMKVNAVYNDGSFKKLGDYDYEVSKLTALEISDKSITLSYTEDTITKTKDVSISVVSSLNNGEIKKIEPSEEFFTVREGEFINSTPIKILATYQSGNKRILASSTYEITNTNEKAMLGKAYSLNVRLTSNHSLTTSAKLLISSFIEGENCTVVGGTQTKTETEYKYVNGALVSVGNVTFAGGFSKTVEQGGTAYIQYAINSASSVKADISMRCANSYLAKIDEDYWMKPLVVNSIADLSINGDKITIDDDVILAGCGPHSDYAPLYNVYSEFTFNDIQLKAGENVIKLQFKKSTLGEKNHWNESPSTMNIDYITLETAGKEIDKNAKVTEIYFADDFNLSYGDSFDTAYIPVFAKYDTNDIGLLSPDELIITKPSGYVTIGSHTVTATLIADSSKTCTKTFVVDDIVLEAENATKSGNDKVVNDTQTEYSPTDQSALGSITAVGGMDNSTTKYSGETSLTFTFNGAEGAHGLKIRCDNTLFRASGSNNTAPYYTEDVDLAQCVDIYINGVKLTYSVNIPSLPASLNIQNSGIPWWTFFELTIGNINLNNGQNTIKIVGKKTAPKNRWNENSIPKFDYIKLTQAN